MLFLPVYSMEVYYYYFATMSWFHAPSAMPTDDVWVSPQHPKKSLSRHSRPFLPTQNELSTNVSLKYLSDFQ